MKVQNESFKTIAQTKEKGKSGKAGKCLFCKVSFEIAAFVMVETTFTKFDTLYNLQKRKLEVRPK